MFTGDPYAVLGVARSATANEIKAAYEAKINAAARAGALELMQRVDAAYEIVRDPQRRRHFDATGDTTALPRISGGGLPPVQPRDWSPAEPSPPRRRRRRSVLPTALTLLVALAAAGALYTYLPGTHVGSKALAATRFGNDYVSTQPATGDGPALIRVTHPTRQLPRVAPPAGTGGYALTDPKYPDLVRFDPCRPIHYVVSGAEPWPGADTMLRAAVAEVSRATGLRFVDDGPSTEPADADRASYQPARYGNRWAPVLIAWSDANETRQLAGDVLGIGGGSDATVQSQSRLVSGIVFYDGADLRRMMRQQAQRAEVRVVLLHELGHLVGLRHQPDKASVMYPTTSGARQFSAGDLRGLAAAGNGPCTTLG